MTSEAPCSAEIISRWLQHIETMMARFDGASGPLELDGRTPTRARGGRRTQLPRELEMPWTAGTERKRYSTVVDMMYHVCTPWLGVGGNACWLLTGTLDAYGESFYCTVQPVGGRAAPRTRASHRPAASIPGGKR